MRNEEITLDEVDDLAPIDEEEASIEDRIRSQFAASEIGDRDIRVYYVPNDGKGSEPYLFSINYSDLPALFDKCIPYAAENPNRQGKFRVRIFKAGRIRMQYTFDVIAPPKSIEPVNSGSPDFSAFIDAMREQNERMVSLVTQAARPIAPPPSPDPFTMMERMSAIMANLNKATPQIAPAPQSNPMEMFGMFASMMEMARELGGGGGETGAMDLIKEFIKSGSLQTVMGNAARPQIPARPNVVPIRTAQQNPKPNIQSTIPTPKTETTKPIQTPEAILSDPNVNQAFIAQLHFLAGKAENGSDPALYAELAFDNLPDETINAIILYREQVIQNAMVTVPAVAKNRAWFEAFLDALTDTAQGAAEPEPEETNATGGTTANVPGLDT